MIFLSLTFWGSLVPYSRGQTTHVNTFLINTCIGVPLHTAFPQFPSQICVEMNGKIWYTLKSLWIWLSLCLDHAFFSASEGNNIPQIPILLSYHSEEGGTTKGSPEEMHYWNNKYYDLFCPSLIWCDSRGLRQTTFFIFPHPSVLWCSYSLLFGDTKLFTCFHPQKKHVGIRCWNLGWGGETWSFIIHGFMLQDDGDKALNGGAALFIHFAWSGAGETLAHRDGGSAQERLSQC